jgi:hypothetical protein
MTGGSARHVPLRPNAHALAVLDEMREPLERRILGPITAAGYDAPLPVLTKQPQPLEVRYTDRATTLIAADYSRDPIVNQDSGLICAPKSERRKLKRLGEHGIDPDQVWILREIPGTWRPGETPPRMIGLTAAQTARTRHAQHLQVGAAAFVVGRALLYTAGAAFVVATGAVVALGAVTVAGVGLAAGAATAPLEGGLDPIVLAGVTHPETGAVAWVPVAAWDEIEDERRW